jgi:GT2 family glycosyltransferase
VTADPEVTVVVMSRNRREELLATILRHEAPVILVDNASTDGSAGAVEAAYPHVQVIRLPRNRGAAARTVGARAARTELVAFADDDSWWEPGALAAGAALMRAHPRLAVVNARILVGGRRLDPLCAQLATSPLGTKPGLPGPSVLGFIACAALVRRQAFLDVGGFDDVVIFPGEEERVALDLAAAGWDLVYAEDLVVQHHPSPRRDSPALRRARVLRSALLTAVMRRPWPVVAGRLVTALRAGRPGLAAVRTALPQLTAALRARRPVPAHVEALVAIVGG